MTTSTPILQQLALAYLQHGLPAIPLYQGRPLVPWRTYQDRSPGPEELEALPWQKADGMAIICGHPAAGGGFWWVLDVEHQFRSEAEAWLDQHCPGWREGLVAETQRGGLHIYLRSRQAVRTGKCIWGDIRATGGLAVCPPSKAYKPGAIGGYRWVSYQPQAAPWLEPSDLPWPTDSGQQGVSGREPLREVLQRTIPKGTRNVTLTRIAGLLRGQLDLPPDEVLTILRVLNDSHCEEPLPDEELQAIARSSGRWLANPVLVVENGHRHSLITANSDSESDEPEAIDVSTLPEPPRRGWLVPDLLPEGTVTTWYGDDGTGKSILAQALAICIASGQPFLDRPVQQGVVLFIDTEFDQDEFIRRAYQLARGMGFSAPPVGVFYFRTRYSLSTPGGQRDIVRLVERYQPVLLIIDSITLGAYTSDLKEASATTSLMEFLQQLRVTTLVLDHIPKPLPGTSLAYARPWGSFAKRAKTRHAVLVTPSEAGGVVLRVTKSNLAKAGTMVGAAISWEGDATRVTAVSLDDDALAGVEHHLPALEQVYRTLCQHEAMTPEELSEATGLATGTIRNRLTILRRQGRAEPLGDGRWRGIVPATLVVRDDGRQGFITITGYKGDDGDDDPGKPENPHQNCKIGEHDPGGVTVTVNDAVNEPENPHQNCKIGEHDPGGVTGETELSHREAKIGEHGCVVCGKPVARWGGRPARYCSDACRMKAQRQRQPPANTPGQGVPVHPAVETAESGPPDPGICLDCHQPITDPGFSYRCPGCLKAVYDRLQREYPQKLVDWLQQQHGHCQGGVNSESEPNGRRSPGDSPQPALVEQGPDDIIGWGERLLAELRAGRVQLPVVELKPGHTVLVPERFLASHIAEGKFGIGAAVENLRLYRRALELVSEEKKAATGRPLNQ